MADVGHESKYLGLGKRIAWAANPEQRRFARQLAIEGSGPRKIAAALNKKFGLTINANSLGGFIFSKKGDMEGPAWFIQFLSDESDPAPLQVGTKPVTATKTAASSATGARKPEARRDLAVTPPPEPPLPTIESSFASEETSEVVDAPQDGGFNYDEYVRMSLQQERHAPGNSPLRLKAPKIAKRKPEKE